MEKFSIDSDYVDSYLDSVLLSRLPYSISKQGDIYARCVNLQSVALKIGDCENAKSNVDEFNKLDEYVELKNRVKENCQQELFKAHSTFYNYINNQNAILNNSLKNCVDKTLNI